jgi:hypothetical protein
MVWPMVGAVVISSLLDVPLELVVVDDEPSTVTMVIQMLLPEPVVWP